MNVKPLLFLALTLTLSLAACAPESGPITSSISSDSPSDQPPAPVVRPPTQVAPPQQQQQQPQPQATPVAPTQETKPQAQAQTPATKPEAPYPKARTTVTYTAVTPPVITAPQERKVVTVPTAPAPPAAQNAQTYEQELLELLNASRAQGGLKPLKLSVTQSTGTSRCIGSYGHSVHMQQMNAIGHDQFPQDICLPAGAWAENVGMSSGSEDYGIRTIHKGMMDEGPGGGHYKNIMNPNYNTVGIGLYYKNGIVWLTENFLQTVD